MYTWQIVNSHLCSVRLLVMACNKHAAKATLIAFLHFETSNNSPRLKLIAFAVECRHCRKLIALHFWADSSKTVSSVYSRMLLLLGGALSFSCGLHLSNAPSSSGPVCLVAAGASIQEGKLQWASHPTKFFVPGTAIASLKVIPGMCLWAS